MTWCGRLGSIRGCPRRRCHGSAREIDEQVDVFRTRGSTTSPSPTCTRRHLRQGPHDHRIVSRAVVVARSRRRRQPGGPRSRRRRLRRRGVLDRVLPITQGPGSVAGCGWSISDAHAGLKAAIAQMFTGASWQRCKVHCMRNILGTVASASKGRWSPPPCARSSPNPTRGSHPHPAATGGRLNRHGALDGIARRGRSDPNGSPHTIGRKPTIKKGPVTRAFLGGFALGGTRTPGLFLVREAL